jgi:GMP synthase-like glutamine amidotransferase
MSKIAILSHEVVGAELAILGEWADARGHEITRYFREQKWDAQDVLAADLLILLGSPNSVSTGYEHPSSPQEIELVKTRIESDQPYFGICYGSQIMARALGGEVNRREEKNIGFKKITSESPDVHEGSWMLWHEDFIDPTSINKIPGVEILATDVGAAIAFRKGKAWAVQFHPESDSGSLGRMVERIGVPQEKWEPISEAMKEDEVNLRERSFALFDQVFSPQN